MSIVLLGTFMVSPLDSNHRSRMLIAFLAGITLCALVVFSSGLLIDMRATSSQPGVKLTAVDAGQKNSHEMAKALKNGGYILYFRHPARQKWDSVIAFDVYEAATGKDASTTSYADAVCLTAKGKEEAKMMGQILKMAEIPVGTVAASPSCRARQAAQLAFGHIDVISHGLIHTPVVNETNAEDFKQELKKLLTTINIGANTNTIISAHENTIRNHPDLFLDGSDLLKGDPVLETGLYVIQRDAAGGLNVVHKFMSLGALASNAIALSSTGAPLLAGTKPASVARQP